MVFSNIPAGNFFFQAGSNIPKAFFDPSMNPGGAASGSSGPDCGTIELC